MVENTEVQYHRISLGDINPYFERELESTVYLLGSPGAGKTRFMGRLRDETGGTLVIESGMFDLFQRHVIDFVRRKKESGYDGRISDFFVRDNSDFGYSRDPLFMLPEIDGLNVWNCLMSAVPLDKTLDEYAEENWTKGQEGVCRNLPYGGWGAYHYRESLGNRIRSGGKSGFPDWLFMPRSDGGYVQVISYPGHHRIADFLGNKSIPKVPAPDSVLYLVDPNIDQFDRGDRKDRYGNDAIAQVHVHLADAIELERGGVPVNWVLSKTKAEQLEENRRKANKQYSSEYLETDLSEIARRVGKLQSFDSFESSSEDILRVLETAIRK